MADALGDDDILMLRGHGAVVGGASIEEVITKCLKLEYNSSLLYKQKLIGEPWYLPQDLANQNVDNMMSEGQITKTLDYYFSQL